MSSFHPDTQSPTETQHRPTTLGGEDDAPGATHLRSLIAIVAIAILLRILFLGKSLWLDEGIAVGNAWAGGLPLNQWSTWFADLWSRSEFNMVFYFAALRFWLRVGTSEAFIRLLSVIPAVATLPLVYAIGKRMFDGRVAVVATLLLAVHGAHVGYSEEARGYTMVVFFCAVVSYFFLRGVEDHSWKFWIGYSVAAAVGTYCHLFALLVVASHWISLLVLPRRSVPWAKLVLASALLLVAVAPALAFAVSNHGHQVEWIPRLGPSQVLNALSEFAGSPAALLPYLLLWVFALSYYRRAWSLDAPNRWHLVLVLSWAVAPSFIVIAVSIRRPMLVPRYLLISAPASVLLAAVGASQLRTRMRHIAVWSAVVLSIAFVAFRYTRPKENWRDATAYVVSHARQGDAVVVVPAWSAPVFDYYLRRTPQAPLVHLQPEALRDQRSLVTAKAARLWVVTYTRDYALREPDVQMVSDATSKSFQSRETANFRTLQVRCYVPAQPAASTSK